MAYSISGTSTYYGGGGGGSAYSNNQANTGLGGLGGGGNGSYDSANKVSPNTRAATNGVANTGGGGGGRGGAGGGTGHGGSGVAIIRYLTPDSCTPTAGANWAITCSDNCSIVGQVYNVKNITLVGSGNITFTHLNVTYDFMGRNQYCGIWKSGDSILAGRIRPT